MNGIKLLWEERERVFREIQFLEEKAESLKKQIEQEVANHLDIKQTLMSRWFGCDKSPTGYCFVNPNSDYCWKCIYCNTDHGMPRPKRENKN